jgi:hypothetical protein
VEAVLNVEVADMVLHVAQNVTDLASSSQIGFDN